MLKLLKKWLKKIKSNYCDNAEQLVHFICTQEGLPTPLPADEEEIYIKMLNTDDYEIARAKLIEHNLRLVIYISKKFTNTTVEFDDLVSIGIVGLIKAVRSFNIDKNIKLATYASRCIENEILMHLRKVSKSLNNISLEEPLSRDSEGNELMLQDILQDNKENVVEEVEKDSDRAYIIKAVNHLHPREKRIIEMRYGLEGRQEYTQKQVAEMLGISQSYISRLEKRILTKLKGTVNIM